MLAAATLGTAQLFLQGPWFLLTTLHEVLVETNKEFEVFAITRIKNNEYDNTTTQKSVISKCSLQAVLSRIFPLALL